MSPAIAPGDEVEIDPFSRPPRIGEVVLYLDDGGATILHRVVDRRAGWIRTAGDASSTLDAPVPLERVLGIAKLPSRPALSRLRFWRSRARAGLRALWTLALHPPR